MQLTADNITDFIILILLVYTLENELIENTTFAVWHHTLGTLHGTWPKW